MSFSTELLQAPPQNFATAISLEALKGMAESYVHRRKERATLKAVQGQAEWATRCGASKEDIRRVIEKTIANPRADADRAHELTRMFLGE